jgi:uncharacterized protein (TIGR02145 family)
MDNCNVCDNDSTNDCVKDCADVWGGTSWVSDCGCVSATNSGDDCDDCYGTPNGTAFIDVCNNCVGGTTGQEDGDTDLDGICNTLQGTVTDIDGNTYKTIIIGTQKWMGENLKTTKYKDGTAIIEDNSTTTWGDGCCNNSTINGEGKYRTIVENSCSICQNYGNHYNWIAAIDAKGLCMDGWHVPTDDEWQILVDYLGGEQVAGGKMKSIGTYDGVDGLWLGDNIGATNSSGFNAIPAGYIDDNGGTHHWNL